MGYRQPNRFETNWSQARIDTLTRLWKEGASAGYIADTLGYVTRNAVIGKANRLGLKGRVAITTQREIRRRRKQRDSQTDTPVNAAQRPLASRFPGKVGAPDMPAADLAMQRAAYAPAGVKHKHLLDLEPDDCRWPFGDSPFTFCGCPKIPGSSYCADHARLAFEPAHVRPGPALFTRAVAVNVGPEDLPESLVKAA